MKVMDILVRDAVILDLASSNRLVPGSPVSRSYPIAPQPYRDGLQQVTSRVCVSRVL